MWQPGWEGSLGENGYMYMYGWVPSLFTWNYHSIPAWRIPWTEKPGGLQSMRSQRVRWDLATKQQHSWLTVLGEQQRNSAIHIHISILPQTPLPSRLPHNIEKSFLCYTVGPCWLSILNVTVYTCPSQTPVSSSHSPSHSWLPGVLICVLMVGLPWWLSP